MNLDLSTEGLARSSSRHPWITIGAWVVGLVVAFGIVATLLGDALTVEFKFINEPESQRGFDLLEDRLRGPRKSNEIVVVQSETLTVDDAIFQQRVEELFNELMELGDEVFDSGANFYLTGDESLVSPDRRTTILPFVMAGEFADANDNIEGVREIVIDNNGVEGFTVLISGEASIAFESNEVAEQDLLRGEAIGVPVAMIILLLLFGAIIAALLPVVLAFFSIFVALALAALVGQVFQLSFFVTNMIFMIGLAVGIDYSLFIVSRFREERTRGLDKHEAIARTGATASRAVLFSGITVVLALIGMLIVPTSIFVSLGGGAIMVVIASVLASLTLLPAVLSVLGDRVNSLKLPFVGRKIGKIAGDSTGGFWNWVTMFVMKRPVITLVVTAGVLIAATVPYFSINTGFLGVSTLPDRLQSKQAFEILEKEFSFGLISPTEIVIDGDIDSPGVQQGIEDLTAALAEDASFIGKPRIEVNDARDLALLTIIIAGDPNEQESLDAIDRLRHKYIPDAFGGVSNAEALVTGVAAFNIDFSEIVDQYTPYVFAMVLGLSFILLTLVFRSIVIPIKAIIMNLLSVGAAYGIMVLVMQHGFAAGILGFQQVDRIEAWIPLFMFSVLFGLSMDYHVFMLSRIRERYDQGYDNNEAVAYGLRSTAGLITGAALIMVAVFGGFAMGDLAGFQQVGFGLAVAVFLDATIVRSLLVPASMRLLGHRNWYLPSVLNWIPDLRVEGGEPEVGPATAANPAD